MLVRIVKPMQGVLDGASLAKFVPGDVYEVEQSLALQLIALGGAVRERANESVGIHADLEAFDVAPLTGGVLVVPMERAEDRRRRPKKRR